MRKNIFLVLIILVFNSIHILYAQNSKLADDFFKQNNFDKAFFEYGKELRTHPTDPVLFYNMGTCQLKLQNYAMAILYFEKSLKYKPNFVEAAINLQVSNSKLGKSLIPQKNIKIVSIFNSIKNKLSSNNWFISFIILFTISIFILFNQYFFKFKINKNWGALPLTLSIISLYFSFILFSYTQKFTDAIVVSKTPELFKDSTFSNKSNIFIIPGQKINILSEYQGIYKIQMPNGTQGFIASTDVEKI